MRPIARHPTRSRRRTRFAGTYVVHAVAASTLAVSCAAGQVESARQGSAAVVLVIPGSATVAVGDSVRLRAVVLDQSGDTLRSATVQWRSANDALAHVSPAGVVHAIAPGLAGITAQSGTRTGTGRVIVTPLGAPRRAAAAPAPTSAVSPPADSIPTNPPVARRPVAAPVSTRPPATAADRRSGPAHPNEPDGFRRLADRAFLTKAARDDDRGDRECRGGSECWDGIEYKYQNFSIIEDASAPFSCCTIARMRYRAGHRSGTAPATVQTTVFRPPVTRLYVSIWARLSANWHGNQSSTNKMFFVGVSGGNNEFFLSAEGRSRGALVPQVRMQGVQDPRPRIRPNVLGGAVLTRGAWQHWELVLTCNSRQGAADGRIDFWLDGRQVTSVNDVNWTPQRHRARPCDFTMFHWSPTYGGGGAPPPAEQYLDFDHVYVSGR